MRSLTAFFSIILWLCGALTFADPDIYVRKKLPARSYTTVSDTLLSDKQNIEESASEADNSTPPESITESDSAERQALPGPPPSIPNATPIKLEATIKSVQKLPSKQKSPVTHPVVQSPIPLAPAKIEELKNEEAPEVRTTLQKPLKPVSQPTPKKARIEPQNRPKEKPLVRFPEGILPQAETAAISPRVQPKSMFMPYPKGYKMLPMPVIKQQAEWHQEALQAYETGNAMGRESRLQNAISAYQTAIQLSPNFADAHIGLSTAYILKSDWENALYHAQKGLSLRRGFIDPSNITRANYNLSATYCVMDHYGKAKQYYDKVKKVNYPLTPQLWAYLQQNCKK
jgi:tetratricopeptide (TPR) repeat protein